MLLSNRALRSSLSVQKLQAYIEWSCGKNLDDQCIMLGMYIPRQILVIYLVHQILTEFSNEKHHGKVPQASQAVVGNRE